MIIICKKLTPQEQRQIEIEAALSLAPSESMGRAPATSSGATEEPPRLLLCGLRDWPIADREAG